MDGDYGTFKQHAIDKYGGLQLLKHLRVSWCLLETFCFSGLHYGWPSLVYILKQEGFFADGCEAQEKTMGSEKKNIDCDHQDGQLALLYSLASGFAILPLFLCGVCITRFGPIKTRIVWICMFVLGCCLMIISSPDMPWFAGAGLTLIAGGGFVFLLTNMQISRLYKTGSYLLIALFNGCYNSSSVIMLFVKLAYEAGIGRRISFAVILGLSLTAFVNTFVNFNVETSSDDQEHNDGLGSTKEGEQNCTLRNIFKKYACNRMFISHMTWCSAMAINLGYSITSSNIYIRAVSVGSTSTESSLTNFFSIAMFMGIVPSLLAGIFMERFQYRVEGNIFTRDMKTCIVAFFTTTACCALMDAVSMFHEQIISYISFIILSILRAFLFSIAFAFVAKAFPPRAFGVLAGLIDPILYINFFFQGALIKWQQAYDDAEFHIRIALLVLSVISLHHPITLLMTIRRANEEINIPLAMPKANKEVNEIVDTSREPDTSDKCSLCE